MEKQELLARRRREKTAKGKVGLQSGAAEEADDKKSVLAPASSINTTVTNTGQPPWIRYWQQRRAQLENPNSNPTP